jgi:hypothetical protein
LLKCEPIRLEGGRPLLVPETYNLSLRYCGRGEPSVAETKA